MVSLLKDAAAVVGPILIIGATYGYIKAIKHGEVRPHRITWAVWAVATTAGWIATLLARAGLVSLIIPTAYTLIEIWVVKLAWGKYGYHDAKGNWAKPWEKALAPIALGAGAGWYVLVHWHTIGLTGGVVLAIIGDFLAAVFTLRKEIEDPASEPWRPWAVSCLGACLGIAALHDYSFTAAGFTIYLAAMTGVITLWVFLAQQFAKRNTKGRG